MKYNNHILRKQLLIVELIQFQDLLIKLCRHLILVISKFIYRREKN